MDLNVEELIVQLKSAFIPEKAAGVDADVQLHLTGDKPWDGYVAIHNQQLDVLPGTILSPNLTISANAQDVLDLNQRKLNPMAAFMQGRVRVSGDTGLAMRMLAMFRMP